MDLDLKRALANIGASYAKRWFEGNVYDRLFETELGERLKGLDRKTRYGIEGGIYVLTAIFDQKLSDDTALKSMVKEISTDAGPEVAKRLVNGVREGVGSHGGTPEDSELLACFLDLDDETLVSLLDWLYSTPAAERDRILEQIASLSPERLASLARLTPEERRRLLELRRDRAPESVAAEEPPEPAGESFAASFNRRWSEWLNERSHGKGDDTR